MKARFALMTSAALIAFAPPPTLAAPPGACNPGGTQLELNACAGEDYAAADAELNAVWRELLNALAGDDLAITRARTLQLRERLEELKNR